MQTLQQLVWYVNNAKMTGAQRDLINKAIIDGIITGSFDTDSLFLNTRELATSVSVQQFLIQYIPTVGGAPQQATRVYEAYAEWCTGRGLEPVSLGKFGMTARILGVAAKKRKDANYYQFG